ncbi:MAG TPA: DUF4214 domain-containing protein, partial [Pyrinomonadaceae bacterium]|nr:DUF4214 domain-containing protein [Pyrinomonadaceae bacterium]
GDVTLSAEGGALSGLIYSPEGVYEIVPQEGFTHLLVQIDQSRFPPCGGALPAPATSETALADATTPKAEMSPATFGASAAADDGSQLDVLVIYTSNVRTALGGTTQAEAFAQEAINTTNTAYINSDIHTRLRLAGALEVGYAETGDLSAALTWAANDETVKAARNSARADLVAFIAERGGNLCGVGRLMTHSLLGPGFQHAAYSVSARQCSVGNLSFAHELGHNLGCQHNPENGGPPDVLAYPYAFGHYVDQSFRTVMSYSDPCTSPNFCPRVAYFSNPSVNFNGVPTGIADQRDNHRVINNTALIVSQFRESTVSAPPANDNFANALALGGASGIFNGSNNGATHEPGEPLHAFRLGGASVWFTWQAPSNGSTTITTAGSTFNTVLAVYTGDSLGGLTSVASNDDVNFATGESSVTFNATAGTTYRIAVDGYASGVTGDLKLNWSGPLASGEPLLNPDFFVTQHYRDFLNRDPDSGGLAFWVNQMTNCASPPPADPLVCRVNVSAAFFLSIEFQETGFLVYRLQRSSFGTRPTFAPFTADARQLAQGLVVGQTGWEQLLESNKSAFVEAWVQRPNFLAEFPTDMTAQEYVSKLSQRASVTLTPAESQSALSAYGGGGTTGRALALRAVVESQTTRLAHKNAAYVQMEYFGYLRRDPDEEGFNFWLAKLEQFGGDAIAAEMVKAFITSDEYRRRFGQ